MTHPLTPREKVEQAVKDAIREDASVGLQMTLTPRFIRGLVDRVLAATSVVDHEAGFVSDILTALASGSGDHSGGVTDMIGSGDHAELARLAEAATPDEEPCPECGDGDGVPASGYWICPTCDAEWNEEDEA